MAAKVSEYVHPNIVFLVVIAALIALGLIFNPLTTVPGILIFLTIIIIVLGGWLWIRKGGVEPRK